jgi:hypothetical protein
MKVFGCKRVEVSAYWRDQMQQNYMVGASGTWVEGGKRNNMWDFGREICTKRNT